MTFIEDLQAEAFRLGFQLAGVAPVQAPPHYATYRSWIDAGLQASMGYLSTQRALDLRAQPRLILPEARSLLVVALRYPDPRSIPELDPGEGLARVAAYAWGEDYHEIMLPRMEMILAWLGEYLGTAIRSRSYTDTGPILERDFGQQAGLGWIGKHTCLISPQHGSYFLLGESLIDYELEPSMPFKSDQCGTCTRCIQACPTNCIRPDRTIDSIRCISYQTIENKGSIQPDLRPFIGNWAFGCDICQMVCPWNIRFSTLEGHPALAPQPAIARPSPRKDIHLSAQEFNHKFRRSPIRRAKRRGYLRNLAVVIGNQKDTHAVPDLAQVMENEPESLVRAHAAWALGRMRTSQAKRVLEKANRLEVDLSVQGEIQAALSASDSS